MGRPREPGVKEPVPPSPSDVVGAAMLRWGQEHGDRGAFTTDVALHVQSWNRWLTLVTGVAPQIAIGRPLFDVLPSLVERGFDQYYAEALAGQVKVLSHSLHRFILPTQARGAGDQMPQRGQIAPLTDGEQIVGTITIIEDVSERVAVERELRARIAKAEQARAIAEAASRVKDEFLATLSHEIRTPLNAVLGWTRILRSRDFDKATAQRAIEVIDRNASAQLTLISDMLDMARMSAGKVRLEMTDVDLSAIAVAAIDVVRPAADAKGVRLVADLSPRLPTVAGDRDRLLQVVWNLLSNAVKFTGAGGRVTVTVAPERALVRLSVSDTGQGIAPEFLPQVFERFKQADSSSSRRHGGLGLGLALVRELVQLHGGSVSVDSDGIGLGSTFTVALPARPVAHAQKAQPSAARPEATGALVGVRILVVEDDADAREIIVRSVTDVGASVTAVASATEALAILRERNDTDVVLTDIGMPGDDGYAFLRELRRLPNHHGGKLPAIALTAYATKEDQKRALQEGFVAHVGKPFAPMTLISTIARALGTES
jgi:PAS domain S-box-containing protein